MQKTRPPIIGGNYPSIRIDIPTEGAENSVNLMIYEDLYKNQFYPHAHHNFIGNEPVGDHFIITVLANSDKPTLHRGLRITKKGYNEELFTIPDDPSIPLVDRIASALPNFVDSKDPIYPVFNPNFPADILRIEEKHPQKRSTMKIGIVYCKKGQNHPQEFFKNGQDGDELDGKFWQFLSLLGDRINLEGWTKYSGDMKGGGISYYTVWENVEIIYHVSPLLNAEGHRRLIGNDIGVVFYLEEGDDNLFDPNSASLLGTVPQVFAVVQPYGDKFRLGFFANINIKQFDPPLPLAEILDDNFTKKLLLTKMYNGLVMANYCPPMNRLFYVPRKETIESIIHNYPMETRRERRAREKKERKEKETKITLDDTEVTFENMVETYSDINALVLLVATSIAYHEGRLIPNSAEKDLGIKKDNVEVFELGDVQGYVAGDNEKIFIIFGGLLNIKNFKKTMKDPKASVTIANAYGALELRGEVHKGFSNPVIGLWDRVDDIFSRRYKGQKIWFAGHSLGGAVAMLTAQLFADRRHRDAPDGEYKKHRIMGVYLYGCPKIGDGIWGKYYDDLLKNITYRVNHSNDIVPLIGTKAADWYHGGNTTLPTLENGLLQGIRLNTPLQSGSSHLLPNYFAVLAPLHKIALERTLKDLHRDRIYSRNMKHTTHVTISSDLTWDESDPTSSVKPVRKKGINKGESRRVIIREIPENLDSFPRAGDDSPLSISRPSRRLQSQPPPDRRVRRSKSLNSLNAFVDDEVMTRQGGIHTELEDLMGQISDTKLNIQSLVSLLSVISNEDLNEDIDFGDFARFKLLKDIVPNDTYQPDHWDKSHQNDNGRSEKNSKSEPGKIQFRPSVLSLNAPILPIVVGANSYSMQQQPVIPVLPSRAAVQTIPSRNSQTNLASPLSTSSDGKSPASKDSPNSNRPRLYSPARPTAAAADSPTTPRGVLKTLSGSYQNNVLDSQKTQTSDFIGNERRPKDRVVVSPPLSHRTPPTPLTPVHTPTHEHPPTQASLPNNKTPPIENQPTPSPLPTTKNPAIAPLPQNTGHQKDSVASQRVPKEVRQLRTRSKSLSELNIVPPPVESSDNNASLLVKRDLLAQLRQHLTLLVNVLNVMNPQNVNITFEKLTDTIMRIVQRVQSGQSQSGTLERNLYNFSRVCPKFKQIVEVYKNGSGNPQILTEILALFKRVTSDLLATITHIYNEQQQQQQQQKV